jgi:hypothetical protein
MRLPDIFHHSEIRFEFEFSKVNNKTMCVDVVSQHERHRLWPDSAGPYILSTQISMPDRLHLIFSNKDLSHDTILADGQIVQDLCVKVTKIWVDGISVPELVLQKILKLKLPDGKEITSNYAGFNGEMALDLVETCVFDQIMTWRRLFMASC